MIKKIIRISIVLISGLLIGFALFVLAVNFEVFGHLYSKKELKDFRNQTATQVFSRDGVLIGQFFDQKRTNISFYQIPSHVVEALVATEDARYFEHAGVDSRSLFRVLFKTILLSDESSGGGSTITQQLLKNMYGRQNFGPLTMPVNKVKEGILAYRLESIYNKQEILALYLNTIPFGGNVYGIEAASRLFFNKSVTELTLNEGAVLVGMLKANTYYNPRKHPDHAVKRRNVVLKQMHKYEYLSIAAYDSLKTLPIKLDYANLESSGPANYFLVQVKRELKQIVADIESQSGVKWDIKSHGLKVETTLDFELQQNAQMAFEKHLGAMQSLLRSQYTSGKSLRELNKKVAQMMTKNHWVDDRKRKQEIFSWDSIYYDSLLTSDSLKMALTTLHAGFFALNPKSGEVLAWIGGIDFRSQPYDQVRAKRQMASTFKPILYAAALEKGISPCDYLSNTATIFKDQGNWKVKNYDHTEGGRYSLTGALMRSKNIPTVDLLFKTGFDDVDYLWRKMGFSHTLTHVPAMALGTTDASLYELAVAYAAFANGGFKITPKTISRVLSSEGEVIYEYKPKSLSDPILDPNTSIVMNHILEKAINHGTGRAIRNTYGLVIPLAGKTGTSQNFSDAWFAAYNPNIVVVTRVGAASPSIHFNNGRHGSGGRLALPIVGLTLKSMDASGSLGPYITSFPSLSPAILNEFDCPDFMEDTAINKMFRIFKRKSTTTKAQEKKAPKKKNKRKSWFRKKE